jgi:hypothetical protein
MIVAKTDPSLPDTGSVGVLDGFKDPDRDGWTNLEEFRRRTDPNVFDSPPQPVELKQPTMMEVMQASALHSDLRHQPAFLWREPGARQFVALPAPLWTLFPDRKERAKFDLKIYWPRAGTTVPR